MQNICDEQNRKILKTGSVLPIISSASGFNVAWHSTVDILLVMCGGGCINFFSFFFNTTVLLRFWGILPPRGLPGSPHPGLGPSPLLECIWSLGALWPTGDDWCKI